MSDKSDLEATQGRLKAANETIAVEEEFLATHGLFMLSGFVRKAMTNLVDAMLGLDSKIKCCEQEEHELKVRARIYENT